MVLSALAFSFGILMWFIDCLSGHERKNAMEQTIRDTVTGELTLEYFVKRSAEGWKVAAIEWVRAAGPSLVGDEASGLLREAAAVPYGLQVAKERAQLEENPFEANVLFLILEQIVKEKRVSEIAMQLNERGYRTRGGAAWSSTEVFNLLPRLIEAGPSMLKSAAWQERRASVQSRIELMDRA